MRVALAAMLFDDDDKAAGEAARASVVAPAKRSARAPGSHAQLRERTREFLRQPPSVVRSDAFGLRESMRKTLDVYHQALADKNT